MWHRLTVWALLLAGIVCLAQQRPTSAYWQTRDSAYNNPPTSGPARMCTDGANAAAFNARTSGQDVTHLDANCVFINGLDTDAVYASGDIAYLIATDTTGNSALNIFSSSFTFTPTNSPTFTADSGYVGGSTSNIDTNFNPSTNGVNYTQNSASIYIWTLTNFGAGTDYGVAVGQHLSNANFTIRIYPHFSDNNYYGSINANLGGSSFSHAAGHFYGIQRAVPPDGATGIVKFIDVDSQADGNSSTALSNVDIILLNLDATGANTAPFTGNLAFMWAGATLGATKEALLCHRVNVYLTTIAGASAGVC